MAYSQCAGEKFDEKFILYGSMLYRLCMVYLKNHANTEDAIQDSFISLIYKSPKFKTPDDEKRWLVRVAINICKDQIKSAGNKTLPLEALTEPGFIESAEDISARAETNDIFHILQTLPEKYKTPIFLHYTEGFTVEEISKMLAIGKSAVKMRLKRGREMLKVEMES